MITFISNNRKKYKYFKKISDYISFKSQVKKLSISLNLLLFFKYKKELNNIINNSIEKKFYEIDFKYKNKKLFKQIYKLYVYFVTPFIVAWGIKLIKKSEAIAIWNGQRFPENLIMDIAKYFEKKRIFFEVGFFPNTTVIDPQGVNFHNSVIRDINFYKNYPIKEDTFPKSINKRNHLIKRKLEYVELPKKYIFVPFQTSFDTQIVYNSPWIKSMPMLFDIIEQIANKTKTTFIFKEHPHERDFTYEELHKRTENNPFIKFANANETSELIKKSEAIITINSTVGLEALLMNKKVIVLGNAFYALDKITKKASNIDELEDIIKNLDKWEVDIDLIKRFLSYLINEYLVKGSWTKTDKSHLQAVENRIKDIINDTYNGNFSKK